MSLRFNDYFAAEHVVAVHLVPVFTEAETSGLISSWFFIRKAPCWRLRFLPSSTEDNDRALRFMHAELNRARDSGLVSSFVETIYEPETHAFGGHEAMTLAHHLFHADSRQILANLYAGSPANDSKRRELSILLCGVLMRSAQQDWYEQGDIWARVAEHRTPLNPLAEQQRRLKPALQHLMTVDPGPLMAPQGKLAFLSRWAAAFAETGRELGQLAQDGFLTRGVRAVLAHHVLFHWNRLGLPYPTQSVLAHTAKAVVLGH